jgi:hypothetical protein
LGTGTPALLKNGLNNPLAIVADKAYGSADIRSSIADEGYAPTCDTIRKTRLKSHVEQSNAQDLNQTEMAPAGQILRYKFSRLRKSGTPIYSNSYLCFLYRCPIYYYKTNEFPIQIFATKILLPSEGRSTVICFRIYCYKSIF